jgi:hypothetical protein
MLKKFILIILIIKIFTIQNILEEYVNKREEVFKYVLNKTEPVTGKN